MFNLKKGSYVPMKNSLKEEYQLFENKIVANVGCDKLMKLLMYFLIYNKQESPIMFYWEMPMTAKREFDTSNEESFKCETLTFKAMLKDYKKCIGALLAFDEILLRDGLCRFGFATQNGDEIVVGKYNIVKVYGENVGKYTFLFDCLGIKKTDEILTAFDTFTKENPGLSISCTYKGMGIRDLPGMLKKLGLAE